MSDIIEECRVDQDAFANGSSTHANIKNRSPKSFGIVIALEEIDGAEQQISVQVMIDERSSVVAVFVWICFVVIKETKDMVAVGIQTINVTLAAIHIV